MAGTIETDVLVVGAGPAGAATATFLAREGVRTLMISRHGGTADTPRAHITNQRAMEVLRDAGLEQDCLAEAASGELLEHSFWLTSMAGEELARAWAWGNDPSRRSDYLTASPCRLVDIPQTKLEPILVTEAARLGAQVRFGWELKGFTQDASGVTAEVLDRISGATVTVRAKYMVGADGARSRIVEQLGVPLVGRGALGSAYNVYCDFDLSEHVVHRHASLYNVVQPGSSAWGPVAVYRMVRPWNQWLVTLIVPSTDTGREPTHAEFEARIRESSGDRSKPIRIRSISKWHINEVYAQYYSVGRVHCMGDAVHRHPPAAALGSNTCLQEALNLGWKLAYVLKGAAGQGLLDSYSLERQPVGKQIVERANKSMGHSLRMMDLLGAGTRAQASAQQLEGLFSTAEGRERLRSELSEARYNGLAHGVEMTRRYESAAIVGDGTTESAPSRDQELYYHPSARPGSVVPHAWLVRRTASPLISTLDLAGKGRFHLFTSHGGDAWREAARQVSTRLGIEIGVTAIGAQLDIEDPYGTWRENKGVEDSGCVLVRPDLIVGWRSQSLPGDPAMSLGKVMDEILARAG